MKRSDAKALMALLGCCCECECELQEVEPDGKRLPAPIQPRPAAGQGSGQLNMPPVRAAPIVDTPYIPQNPSFDTPQRPSASGNPYNGQDGEFRGPGGGLNSVGSMVLDSGEIVGYPTAPSIDHVRRSVTGWQYESERTKQGYSAGGVYAYPLGDAVSRAPPTQDQPYKIRDLPAPHADYSFWFTDIAPHTGRGLIERDITEQTFHFDGAVDTRLLQTLTRQGTIWTAKTQLRQGEQAWEPVEYQIQSRWAAVDNEILRTRYLTAKYSDSTSDPENHWFTDEWLLVWLEPLDIVSKPAADWIASGEWDGSSPTTNGPLNGPLEYQTFEPPQPLPVRPVGERFTAPGVSVTGEMRDNPADLTNSTLTAFGHALMGGTWAALRDNPVRRENGTWDYSPLMVLHELGGTITALRAGREPETVAREVFEREVLRCGVGQFQAFSGVGLGFHSWPPQWAWALCTTECRALVAFDPWRDCTKRRKPNTPASWSWPARPAKRPKVTPSKPTAPLGVTLATVGPALEELHPKSNGPLDLPVLAEVQKDGDWQASPSALAALNKRQLYQPSAWPEELDDSSGVRGEVQLTFESSSEKAAYWIRGKAPPGQPFRVLVNGQQIQPQKLGHNAPEKRGYHPYLFQATGAATITLGSNGVLTRCLRRVTVKSDSD